MLHIDSELGVEQIVTQNIELKEENMVDNSKASHSKVERNNSMIDAREMGILNAILRDTIDLWSNRPKHYFATCTSTKNCTLYRLQSKS